MLFTKLQAASKRNKNKHAFAFAFNGLVKNSRSKLYLATLSSSKLPLRKMTVKLGTDTIKESCLKSRELTNNSFYLSYCFSMVIFQNLYSLVCITHARLNEKTLRKTTNKKKTNLGGAKL